MDGVLSPWYWKYQLGLHGLILCRIHLGTQYVIYVTDQMLWLRKKTIFSLLLHYSPVSFDILRGPFCINVHLRGDVSEKRGWCLFDVLEKNDIGHKEREGGSNHSAINFVKLQYFSICLQAHKLNTKNATFRMPINSL